MFSKDDVVILVPSLNPDEKMLQLLKSLKTDGLIKSLLLMTEVQANTTNFSI